MTAQPYIGQPIDPWRHHVELREAIVWTEVLNDPNPIHFDPSTVAKLGLGDRPINPGPANIAYFYNMLAAAFPTGEARSVSTRMTASVYVGDVVEVTGIVTHVDALLDSRRVHCALVMHSGADRPPVATASAVVHFAAIDPSGERS